MTMLLEVNGVQYDNFTAASCEIRLDALSNTFSFEAVAADGVALPFKGGEACRVIVNNNPVLTGFIEVVEVNYNASEHTIRTQGRDKTGDLLDSNLSGFELRGESLTLKQIIEKAIDDISGPDISAKNKIKVIEEVKTDKFNPAEDVVSAEPGMNAFDFLEKYSRKRQVLLTSNSDGNIVITSGSAETALGSIQHIIGASDNNVLASSFSFDTTGRFNIYKFASQLNPFALNLAGDTGLDSVVDQSGGVTDPNVRIGRQLILIAEAPNSDDQNESRAKWEANIRKARGLVYSVTVPSYQVDPTDTSSELWQINKLYQIVDDYLGKSEPMLCNSVTFTLDNDGGELTSLSFVDQKAYSLDLEKPQTSKTAGLIF
jgi:prophage tail gpP-like protein